MSRFTTLLLPTDLANEILAIRRLQSLRAAGRARPEEASELEGRQSTLLRMALSEGLLDHDTLATELECGGGYVVCRPADADEVSREEARELLALPDDGPENDGVIVSTLFDADAYGRLIEDRLAGGARGSDLDLARRELPADVDLCGLATRPVLH